MKNSKTLETYNKNPEYYSDKFSKHLIRRDDSLEFIFSLVSREASVLELGCGDGKDAEVIIPRSKKYLGIDGSKGMLEIAKKRLPKTEFLLKDITSVKFQSKSFDIIFSFAVLLHLNREEVKKLLAKAHKWLKHGGIFSIYVKEGEYRELEKKDSIGTRYFYFYSEENLLDLAGSLYKKVKTNRFSISDVDWIEVILKKA